MFLAKILADSAIPSSRITTVELTYPRIIHSEFMTHRAFSRNSASSRAIPVEKMIERVRENPFVPIHWGANQKGMQAHQELDGDAVDFCKGLWLYGCDNAIHRVQHMLRSGLHKQIANRLLEPWMWITVIATGNGPAFENFFKLRCHEDAEPHIQRIAYMLRDVYDASEPKWLEPGEWHLPLIGFDGDDELSSGDLPKVSTARCARVSYLTHDGRRDVAADIDLHDRLRQSGHWSPFEHVATPATGLAPNLCGNLGAGWIQYRKAFRNEYCRKAPR